MPRLRHAFVTTAERQWHDATTMTGTGEAGLRLTGGHHQVFRGFGGCFNELGWIALQTASAADRATVLRRLFHPEDGLNLVMNRLPIGASDYAAEWYSHDEVDGDLEMKRFAIDRDRLHLIPYIQEAKRLQPGMTLFASPWSPPTWMKFPKAYNHGRLIRTPAIQAAYALYFARFIEEYAKQGLVINQLHVQNEPAADQKFPSCLWEGHELRDFIRDHLAPCLARRGLATEIWVGTLNTDDFHGWAETILADPECRRHVAGFGYQWAGKNAVQRHAESFPDVPFAQTENECGDGANTWPYALYVFDLIRHYLANDAAFYTYWNLVLKPGGVSTWGWRQNSMVSIDDAGKVTWNPEYWIFRHCATAIRPGARRLGIDGPWRGAALAFANPDGTTGLVVANHLAQPRTLAVAIDHTTISLELPARSIATLVVE